MGTRSLRNFLARGSAAASVTMALAARAQVPPGAIERPAAADPSRTPGEPLADTSYGARSQFETAARSRFKTATPLSSWTFTPLQDSRGILTPSGLHFGRSHAGTTTIDPARHLLYVHGLPKIINFAGELAHIDDPLHVGRAFTLGFAIFAEVLCPVLIVPGILTRLASAAVLVLLGVSMFLVHPDWSVAEGQFGWLLMIVFGSIALMGAGRYSIDAALAQKAED